MAHTPLKMTIPEVQDEVHATRGPTRTAPRRRRRALESIADEPVPYKISHMIARIFFRGIYFPPKGAWGWLKVVAQNRGSIIRIVRESFTRWNGTAPKDVRLELETGAQPQED